jgi:hypothetical protein
MAVVKIKYTRNRNGIKAHLRYIIHRPDRDGEKQTRQLFSADYTTLEKKRAYELIDRAPQGTIFFKIMLSPDPNKEDNRRDLDLWNLTDKTIHRLKNLVGEERAKHIQFFATQHKGMKRHTHAIALVPGRLSKEDFRLLKDVLREEATQEACRQRAARDFARAHRNHLSRTRHDAHTLQSLPVRRQSLALGTAGGRARRIRTVRQPTLPCPQGGMHSLVKLRYKDGKFWCPVHKKVYERAQGLSL